MSDWTFSQREVTLGESRTCTVMPTRYSLLPSVLCFFTSFYSFTFFVFFICILFISLPRFFFILLSVSAIFLKFLDNLVPNISHIYPSIVAGEFPLFFSFSFILFSLIKIRVCVGGGECWNPQLPHASLYSSFLHIIFSFDNLCPEMKNYLKINILPH